MPRPVHRRGAFGRSRSQVRARGLVPRGVDGRTPERHRPEGAEHMRAGRQRDAQPAVFFPELDHVRGAGQDRTGPGRAYRDIGHHCDAGLGERPAEALPALEVERFAGLPRGVAREIQKSRSSSTTRVARDAGASPRNTSESPTALSTRNTWCMRGRERSVSTRTTPAWPSDQARASSTLTGRAHPTSTSSAAATTATTLPNPSPVSGSSGMSPGSNGDQSPGRCTGCSASGASFASWGRIKAGSEEWRTKGR